MSNPTYKSSYTVLHVEAVKSQAPDLSIKTFFREGELHLGKVDLLIAGGGMGGVAAALAALTVDDQISVVLTEETSWLGGQMTSQGVSALDENKWVESTGACLSYKKLRQEIRDAYKRCGDLKDEYQDDPILHPGRSWVTRVSFEPKIAVDIIERWLKPFVDQGRLNIFKNTKVLDVLSESKASVTSVSPVTTVKSALFVNFDDGQFYTVTPKYVIDATELGDLMPMIGVPYYTGSDERARTKEKHAPVQSDSQNVQDFTYPFVLTFQPGTDNTIAKPAGYDEFLAEEKFSFFGFKMFEEYKGPDWKDAEKEKNYLPFWTYRRLVDKDLFKGLVYPHDLSMINWDANDLRGHNIIDKSPEDQRDALALAKSLSLGFLYWLQTEAVRDEPGADGRTKGYPELALDKVVMGTKDGLSKYPYIREARRLKADTIVVESDIVVADNSGKRAKAFADTIGIGHYPVDIHGLQEVPDTAQETKPFQVPYGALVNKLFPNFMAGCKNIGVTHITNGAYRLHPIEWAIGTACGAAAAVANNTNTQPGQLHLNKESLLVLQKCLIELGSPLFWSDDVAPEDEDFKEIQNLVLAGVLNLQNDSLHLRDKA